MLVEVKVEDAKAEEAPTEQVECSCGHSHAASEGGLLKRRGVWGNVKWAFQEYLASFKPIKAVASIAYFRADLQKRFGAREVWVNGIYSLFVQHSMSEML